MDSRAGLGGIIGTVAGLITMPDAGNTPARVESYHLMALTSTRLHVREEF